MREDIEIFVKIIVSAAIIMAIFILPMLWIQGNGRAKFIKQSQGIEMKWYEAAFIEVNINSVDARIKGKGE